MQIKKRFICEIDFFFIFLRQKKEVKL